MRASALAVVALVAACGGGTAGGPGFPGAPPPPPKGQSSALSTSGTVDAAGGSLSLTDPGGEIFTATWPPNAVSAPTAFTLTGITTTAPGGLDGAFRIGAPAGTTLALPMTLSWTMPAGTTVDQVTAADQDPSGYWFRVYSVSRDATAQVLSVQSTFIGDWSLVTLATSRDLHGPFRLDTTQDIPFTATGTVTLQWLGDDAAFAYYLPQGDITVVAPLDKGGGVTCNPVAGATQAMPFSLAEIRNVPAPVQWRWGINGRWDLACSDGSAPFVGTNFDSLGVTNLGCARDYVGAYTITTSHVQGQYLIDCTAKVPSGGKVVASWDLVLPADAPGALPPPPSPWP